MKATQIIRKDINLNITGITLLSKDEAKKIPKSLLADRGYWWLRTPAASLDMVLAVDAKGQIGTDGYYVDNPDGPNYIKIRPAIIISNLNELKLIRGSEIEFAGHKWTVISDNMALCNDTIEDERDRKAFRKCTRVSSDQTYFCDGTRKRYPIGELNDYESSDVKKYIEEWAYSKGILHRPKDVFCIKGTYNITKGEGECPENCKYGAWELDGTNRICGAECLECGGTLFMVKGKKVYCDGCGETVEE